MDLAVIFTGKFSAIVVHGMLGIPAYIFSKCETSGSAELSDGFGTGDHGFSFLYIRRLSMATFTTKYRFVNPIWG